MLPIRWLKVPVTDWAGRVQDTKVPKAESNGVEVYEEPVGRQARYAGAATGKVNRNSAPPVDARPTVMVPPWTSTMPLTM